MAVLDLEDNQLCSHGFLIGTPERFDSKRFNISAQGLQVYRMLYKMSFSMHEISPLFVQLSILQFDDQAKTVYWKEKARWIRFEERAEDVLGRWSKPHVSTIPSTAMEDLRDMLFHGTMLFDVMLINIKSLAETIASQLTDYFSDYIQAQYFVELFCSSHFHHHEKKLKKTTSAYNLRARDAIEMNTVNSSKDLLSIHQNNSDLQRKSISNPNLMNILKAPGNSSKQFSFTDIMPLEEYNSNMDFKENLKFKKKFHRKSEGASVLVMPVDFVRTSKLLLLRLGAATELKGFLEVKLRSRFVVLIIGPIERAIQLYEVGRAISTCLADDVCLEQFYSADSKQKIIQIVHQFNRGTMIIPPGEWNPKIRIEPPEKFMSKEDRKRVPELSEYLHDIELNLENHNDPTLKISIKPFSGLITDIKRKLAYYKSEFTDVFNLQCLATTLYIYLVTLCSLVAFGGLFGQKTDDHMATMECILSGAICGAIFALFSGQPLNIVSATGPALILESIIKGLCDKHGIYYMEFRLWIGLWTTFFLLILVLFNLSFLVKYITRFTEDCFATLVAVVFIFDAIKSILNLKADTQHAPTLEAAMSSRTSSNSRVVIETISQAMKNLTSTAVSYLNSSGGGGESDNAGAAVGTDANAPEHLVVAGALPGTNISPAANSLHEAKSEATFYFSIIIFLATYITCVGLKGFRNKPYLPTKVPLINMYC